MTKIVIQLRRGPEDLPVGTLQTGPGPGVPFTGWLDLIRILEAQLATAERQGAVREPPPVPGPAGQAGDQNPSSAS
jgi:hypothetical protein